ncbi:hypothetical protein [Halosimplex pelagicum]|uniref:Uncharacterized protein n=1 Tax=Halosimplex pelagicum TaxID=869886 RepID=A0A7D5P772_9EURY|nr:hypothetical protein [Halosimplex pelagicum]QLH82481.1 hypothetical protein HZS54_13025 [Halosimplex pelagicum]QLH82537.1 hypothetical protein HZS54_13330 [Halosimplex pelagicum]
MTSPDVDVDELGTVVRVVACPDCGKDLRLEAREGLHEYYVAICPDECFGAALRVGGKLDIDSEAATRSPAGWCVQCQEQIVDDEDAVEVTHAGEDHIVHEGECLEAHRRQQDRLGGASA